MKQFRRPLVCCIIVMVLCDSKTTPLPGLMLEPLNSITLKWLVNQLLSRPVPRLGTHKSHQLSVSSFMYSAEILPTATLAP